MKLVRDYEAEKLAWKEYKEQEIKFLNGEIDKPPYPGSTPNIIYKEIPDDS